MNEENLVSPLDLANVTIRIGTIQNYPYSFAKYYNGKWNGHGVAFEIIDLLKSKLHFNYTLKPYNLTSIVDGLIRNEIDVAGTFLPKLNTNVRYSSNLYEETWYVLMKRPKISATESNLLSPFTWTAWLGILATIFFTGPLFCAILNLKHRLHSNDAKYTILDYFWFIYGGILKQGSTMIVESSSTMILFATWWMYVILVTSLYSANLTAFVTMNTFTLPIRNEIDVVQRGFFWTVKNDGIYEYVERNRCGKSGLDLSSRRNLTDEATSLKKWLRNEKNLYVGESLALENMIRDDYFNGATTFKCNLVRTKWWILREKLTFAYTRSFKYRAMFDKRLSQLFESGIVAKLLRNRAPNVRYCPENLVDLNISFGNSDMVYTYVVVSALYCVCIVIFLIELSLKKRKRARCVEMVKYQLKRTNYNKLFDITNGDMSLEDSLYPYTN